MLDRDVEMFAKGLSELRMYVAQQQKRVVPWNYVSDSSFRLGTGLSTFESSMSNEWNIENRLMRDQGCQMLKWKMEQGCGLYTSTL